MSVGVTSRVCVYRGQEYHSVRLLDDDKVLIISTFDKNWNIYDTYHNRLNGEKEYIYSKVVDIDEIDDFYTLKCIVVYRDHLFTPRAIGKSILRSGRIYISTEQYEFVGELALEPCDRMEYGRFVSPEDIDYLIIEKTYLIGEKKGKIETEKVDLVEYVSNLPDDY